MSTQSSRRKSALRKKRKKTLRRRRLKRLVIIVVVLAACVFAAFVTVQRVRTVRLHRQAAEEQALIGEIVEIDDEKLHGTEAEQILNHADEMAEMYDYDGAIEYLESSQYYDSTPELQARALTYEDMKDECVSWSPDQVTHIFFHTLIVDPDKAFDGDTDAEGYNQYMVTLDEFSKIMNEMYENGYVLVSMHDMCEIDDDGKMTGKSILLPEGKKPFVLSEDDVCYYHYMSDDGFAQKLIIDDDGKVKNTYVEDDGTVSVGDYDIVPWIDTFVEEHPDFSYKGHKGTIALTGYEGVLGYRTDEVYRTKEESRLTTSQREFFSENPDFDEEDWQNEVDQATAVAEAMKAEGWEFASHTWGHINPMSNGLEAFELDTERWEENVEPIVGETDIIIFAFGADIASDWGAYSEDNEYFQYLKSQGFDIYCCVDSSKNLVVISDDCMRMGRRDIDGYRMYYNAERLSDLFDVDDVWDEKRPDEVAQI